MRKSLYNFLEYVGDSEELTNELNACQRFSTDTEMEKGRHKVRSFQLSKLDFNIDIEKLDQVFEKICAAKVNFTRRFVLSKKNGLCNIEMVGEYHYSYAHEINTLLDKPILLCIKAELTILQRD